MRVKEPYDSSEARKRVNCLGAKWAHWRKIGARTYHMMSEET